jgi:hypothetical protein
MPCYMLTRVSRPILAMLSRSTSTTIKSLIASPGALERDIPPAPASIRQFARGFSSIFGPRRRHSISPQIDG